MPLPESWGPSLLSSTGGGWSSGPQPFGRASGLVASETQSAQSGLQEAEQKWGWAHEASSRKPSWTTEAGLGLVSSGLTHLPFTAPLRPLLLQKAMSNPG